MNLQLPRSWLYVPGNHTALMHKASKGLADAIVVDFEDAVVAEEKPLARALYTEHAQVLREHGKQIAVRINALEALILEDLQALRTHMPDFIVLPKVESAEQVAELSVQLEGSQCQIIGLIESPIGLLKVNEIAATRERLVGLSIGTEDLSLEMHMQPCWDSLYMPSMQLNLACKASGIAAIGYVGSIGEFRDVEAFRQSVERSAPLGFWGGFAIHPAQVEVLNQAFTPSTEELQAAQKIVTEFSTALKDAKGAIAVDGKMVDLPVYNRAKQLLERFSS